MLGVVSKFLENYENKVFMMVVRVFRVQDLDENGLDEHTGLRLKMLSEMEEQAVEDR